LLPVSLFDRFSLTRHAAANEHDEFDEIFLGDGYI
jgi:hypothetical protein